MGVEACIVRQKLPTGTSSICWNSITGTPLLELHYWNFTTGTPLLELYYWHFIEMALH